MDISCLDKPSNLGTFSRLPKEVRILIWRNLLPEGRSEDSWRSGKNSLTILRTSQDLKKEIETELYNSRTLTFRISPNPLPTPDCADPNRASTIDIHDQFGSTWSLLPYFHKTRRRQASSSSIWEDTPFEKLKSLRFEVEAPDPADPAQLIQMWKKLCWLMDLLQRAKQLPEIEVDAIETAQRKWCSDGKLQQSSIEQPTKTTHDMTDAEILLSPFLRLRNARKIAVSTTPYGLDLDDADDMDDDMIACYEDTWTVWFDYILDDLPGPSAQHTRLERFCHWTPRYEKTMWCLITGEPEFRGPIVTRRETDKFLAALYDRRDAMRAFKPMAYMRVCEGPDEGTGWETDEELPVNKVRATGVDGWSVGRWWEYEEGIARTSSEEYWRCMGKYGRGRGWFVFNEEGDWSLNGVERFYIREG
jgi:hypothetical protein